MSGRGVSKTHEARLARWKERRRERLQEPSLAIQVLEEMAKPPRRTVVDQALAQRSYVAFSQECGWCGSAFSKSWRVCPICGTRSSINPPRHNSRYHFHELR